MKKCNSWVASIVLAGVTAFAAPAHANLVNNGGFETGDFSGWTQTGDTSFNGAYCGAPDPSIYQGDCAAYFGTALVGGIEQAIHVGGAGLAWDLSFAFQASGGLGSSFSVVFGGQTLLSLIDPAEGANTLYHFSGVSTGSDMTLAFNFADPNGIQFLDGVSLTVVQAPIPEPATMALMGVGLAGLAFLRRRKTV